MKVKNVIGNLVYDTDNPLCSMELCSSQGDLFAFIVAVDIGMKHAPLSEPQPKMYWGKFSWDDETGSICSILEEGGKWPSLRAALGK